MPTSKSSKTSGAPGSSGHGSCCSVSTSNSTRTICFVQRIEYEFSGSSVWPFALCLGDVDNDVNGDSELVVGNVHGDLFIFKHSHEQPWKRTSNLGSNEEEEDEMVSSKRRTSSASMGMGGGHLDSTQSASANVPSLQQQPPPSSQQQQPTAPSKEELPVFHKQSDIGVNVKYMLIDDIDDDGKVELVVGHTDKFVKAYRWEPCCVFSASGSPNTSSSSSCTQCSICGGVSDSSTSSSTATVSLMSANTPKVTESAMRDTCCTCLHPNAPPTSVGDTTTTTTTTAAAAAGTNVDGERGKFVPVYGWRLQFMIGTMSVINWEGKRHLAVAQRGNNYAILFTDTQSDSSKYGGRVLQQQISGGRARNAETNCGILGNISCGRRPAKSSKSCSSEKNCRRETEENTSVVGSEDEKQDLIFGTVTQNGNIYLQRYQEGSLLRLLSLSVTDYHLFPFMYKFDITGEGREEIVVCALNGMTYIIDHARNVVKFPFQQDVLAFVAGEFSIGPKCKSPCLVYVTFNNRIMLYYNIRLPSLDVTSLVENMRKDDAVVEALEKLGIQDDPIKQRDLYRKLLYDPRF